MGFKISQVQEIFVEATAEVQTELLFEVDHMIDATSDINLSEDFVSNEDDNSIVCYVAGALSRSLLKQLSTSRKTCCRELISRGTTLTLDAEDADRSTVQNEEFISMVSRGGLQHPSDCVFVTCAHAYQFYEKVKNDKALDFLLMDSSKPREIFVNTLERKIKESNNLSALAESKCDQGPFIPKIARGLFNVMAKNRVAYTNDDIHANKRKCSTYSSKESVNSRKIRKLASN